MPRGRNDVGFDPACLIADRVAHDLNSILSLVLGNISLVMGFYQHEDKVLENLSRAEQAALKIRDLAQQLMTFARCHAPLKKVVEVGGLVREAASHVSLPGEIPVRFDFPQNLWKAKLDPEQIRLVVKVLLANAVKAMPYGDTLRVPP